METTQRAIKARPMVLRWLSLVELHGSQSGALEAVLRDSDQFERLKRAVRRIGLDPELLIREIVPRESGASRI
jgi:hypothetical protein